MYIFIPDETAHLDLDCMRWRLFWSAGLKGLKDIPYVCPTFDIFQKVICLPGIYSEVYLQTIVTT